MLSGELIKIEGIAEVTGERLKALVFLYAELISEKAILLFLNMVHLHHYKVYKISELLSILDIGISSFERQRKELESFGLVKTYKRDSGYLIDLHEPLKPEEFFASHIFDRLLVHKVDKRYDKLRSLLLPDATDKKNYSDISQKLTIEWNADKEREYIDLKTLQEKTGFPIKLLCESTSNLTFPKELRTKDNLVLISRLGERYGVGVDDMRKYLDKAILRSPVLALDTETLKRWCSSNKSRVTYTNPDGKPIKTPVEYLRELRGQDLTKADLDFVYKLVEGAPEIPDDVINYLLKYTFDLFGQNINQSYIKAILNNWKYKDIDTVAKAQAEIDRFNVSFKRKAIDDIPDYSKYEDSNLPQIEIDPEVLEDFFGGE